MSGATRCGSVLTSASSAAPSGRKSATSARHCATIAVLGAKTTAGRPIRRASSIPRRVLPDPGGAHRCSTPSALASRSHAASSSNRW